jgi:hypothetical protein
MSLKNIQPVCFVHLSYKCNFLLSAHWYLGDLVVQLIEVILSYLSPVIKFILEFTQKSQSGIMTSCFTGLPHFVRPKILFILSSFSYAGISIPDLILWQLP